MMKLAHTPLQDMWLSAVNPLRGLTMARVVSAFEAGQRGDYALLQWLYHFIEKRDATLRGAKRRLRSSLLKLDWGIKIPAKLEPGDVELASAQQQYLRAAYDRVTNLRAALAHLALAEFRGYSHLEKITGEGGHVTRLEPVPQWHFNRDGIYGAWRYQADARMGNAGGEPLRAGDWIIREVDDPINEIALVCFVRKSLSQKDWDSFIARYGIPFVFWVLSEAMAATVANDPGKLAEWSAIMRNIGADGEGIIPGGSLQTLETKGSSRETPFRDHLRYQDEQIVMAATAGKLTMLNDATGLGSGQSESHADTFDEIAIAMANEVSETLQEQFDKPLLEARFPGAPLLAWFELAARDEDDVDKVVEHTLKLSQAGVEMDTAELSERTGYKLRRTASPSAAAPAARSVNRDKTLPESSKTVPQDAETDALTALLAAAVADQWQDGEKTKPDETTPPDKP